MCLCVRSSARLVRVKEHHTQRLGNVGERRHEVLRSTETMDGESERKSGAAMPEQWEFVGKGAAARWRSCLLAAAAQPLQYRSLSHHVHRHRPQSLVGVARLRPDRPRTRRLAVLRRRKRTALHCQSAAGWNGRISQLETCHFEQRHNRRTSSALGPRMRSTAAAQSPRSTAAPTTWVRAPADAPKR